VSPWREDALEDDITGQKVVKFQAVSRRDTAIDGMARAQVRNHQLLFSRLCETTQNTSQNFESLVSCG
jgi:hypothetical protein